MSDPSPVFISPADPSYPGVVDALASDFREHWVLPLLGAGLSIDKPSRLALANALKLPLVESLWDSASFMIADIGPSAEDTAIARTVLESARLERLLDALHETHGRPALEYLSFLNSRTWNLNEPRNLGYTEP